MTLNRSTAPGLLTLAVKFDIVSIRSLCDRLIIELIEDADLNEALKVSGHAFSRLHPESDSRPVFLERF